MARSKQKEHLAKSLLARHNKHNRVKCKDPLAQITSTSDDHAQLSANEDAAVRVKHKEETLELSADDTSRLSGDKEIVIRVVASS